MPRSEFDSVKLTDGSLTVSGRITFSGEAPSDAPMRVAWVLQEPGTQNFSGGVGEVNPLDGRGERPWNGAGLVPSGWQPELAVEASGTLIIGPHDRVAEAGGPSVEHDDAVVWTQVKTIEG